MADDKPTKEQQRIARINQLVAESMAIEAEEALRAGALGYMARALVQATMPHKKIEETIFSRTNGQFCLLLMGNPLIGLPFGSVPRLLVAFLATEAVRTKSREIELGKSLSEFMAHLNEVPTGGRWGTIGRVRDQTKRLFSSSIACTYTAGLEGLGGVNLAIADSYSLWWDPKQPGQLSLFNSHVRLGERFFDEVVSNPVPIDLRALAALKKSPMALDIYTWLTYRMSYLKHSTVVPWFSLAAQFGSGYGRTRDFKAAFAQQLRSVLIVYPAARVSVGPEGLEMRPSPTHVPKLLPRPGA